VRRTKEGFGTDVTSARPDGTDTDLLLTHCRLIDGTGAAPVDDAYILIADGKIRAIGPRLADDEMGDHARFDVSGRTVMPGLIDAHVHLLSNARSNRSSSRTFDTATFVEEKTLHAAANAARALAAGVTTVRDMAGSRPEVSVKHAIDDGIIEGSRVVSAGFVGMTAGHGDMFFPPASDTRPWHTADGEVACRKLVREYVRDGHDLIKICTSGGVLSSGDNPAWRNYTDIEVASVVDEAHALGMRVAAHAHTKRGVLQAVRAGVDTIEHGSMIDKECADLMAERSTTLCPTLTLAHYMNSGEADPPLSAEAAEKARHVHRGHAAALQLARSAGVRIIAGTDSCNTMAFGRHARELALLVDIVAMSPMEAIVAATSDAASALDVDSVTGSLVAGKAADLLIVDGDPLADVALLQDQERLHTIMKDGRPTARTSYRFEQLRTPTRPH
jgi:imidazolonepropionase-like amidohydrolase